jgi:cytochrome c oxidase cbb3-type subunit 3
MKIPPYRRIVPLLAVVFAACDSAPADVREWTAADHDQPAAAQNAPGTRSKGSVRPDGGEIDLAELAWERNCTPCHGQRGRGDGPQGPMLRAPDLTRAEWQDKVGDQEVLEIIRKGRNRMPAFNLPEPVLKGLVQRIRENRQR